MSCQLPSLYNIYINFQHLLLHTFPDSLCRVSLAEPLIRDRSPIFRMNDRANYHSSTAALHSQFMFNQSLCINFISNLNTCFTHDYLYNPAQGLSDNRPAIVNLLSPTNSLSAADLFCTTLEIHYRSLLWSTRRYVLHNIKCSDQPRL